MRRTTQRGWRRSAVRGNLRAPAFVVLAAFGIGIGPGAAVQPCPSHAMGGRDRADPLVHDRDAANPDGGHDGGHAPGTVPGDGRGNGEDAGHQGSHRGGHDDGPCDCLGKCHGCCAPGVSEAGPIALWDGTAPAGPMPGPPRRIFAHPARYRGAQGGATLRLGENDRGWTLGNRYFGTAWWARLLGRNLSAAARVQASRTGNIDGMDEAGSVNPMVVPTARTDLRAGTVLEVGPSFNIYVPEWKAFRIAGELLLPVVRDLDGPQLETDWTLVVGLQLVPIH